MRKKGYTLLELICVLAIIFIIFSLGIGGVKYYQRMKCDMDSETAIYELEDILTFGKSYCLKEKTRGRIVLKMENGDINAKFICDDGFENHRNLGEALTICKDDYITTLDRSTNINISNEGHLSAGSIYLKDEVGNKYKVVVRVGIDLILLKQE